jgi:hypothetical protein
MTLGKARVFAKRSRTRTTRAPGNEMPTSIAGQAPGDPRRGTRVARSKD